MTTLGAIQAIPSRTRVFAATPVLDKLVLAYSAVWIVFLVTGFRMPWEAIPTGEEDLGSLRRQIVFTLGAAIAVHRMIRSGSFGARIGWHFGFVALAIALCSTLIYTHDTVLTFKRSLVHVFGLLLLLSTVDAHPRPVRFHLHAIVVVVGICAWVSIGAYYVFPKDCTTIPYRSGLAGVSGHPNVLGPCLQIGLLLSLALKPQRLSRRTLLHLLQLGMGIALWMTDSVTAIVSTLFGAALFVALTTSSYRAGAIQLFLIALCFVAAFVGLDELRAGFFAATGRDETLSGRDELWKLVYAEGLRHPLFGDGFGAFWHEGRGRELVITWDPRQAHHAWIDVFVDLGIVGLVVVIATIPLRMFPMWLRARGKRGTWRRNAAAAIFASAASMLLVSSWSESFLLKADKLQFFALLWGLLLLENPGPNRFEMEFAEGAEAPPPEPPKRRRRAVSSPGPQAAHPTSFAT